jgi:tRNA A37 threonylcarbamoyladenosine dehydratase
MIFSHELPQCKELGSFVGVTGSFGLAMCSKAIEKLLD